MPQPATMAPAGQLARLVGSISMPTQGITPFPDRHLFKAIKQFQSQQELRWMVS